MRTAIIGDIHANFGALKVLAPAITAADQVVCLGDFVGYYCEVNEVLDFVRGLNLVAVCGNHDAYLLRGCPVSVPEAVRFGLEYADRVIDADHRRWLGTLPLSWGGMIGRRSLLLCHGSPFRPLEDYLYADKIAGRALEQFDYDLLAFGQTHRPLLEEARRPILLNPGSVGQSRHRPGVACAALLDDDTGAITLLESGYDTRPTIELALSNGAGEWVTKHLSA